MKTKDWLIGNKIPWGRTIERLDTSPHEYVELVDLLQEYEHEVKQELREKIVEIFKMNGIVTGLDHMLNTKEYKALQEITKLLEE